MKKLFTLLTLALTAVSGAWAGDLYKISFNGSDAESKNGETHSSYFSNSGKHNFNTKFNGCTYDGVTYTQGLKMEGTTNVSWTSTATSTVTIVQSTYGSKTVKLDGEDLALEEAEAITGGYVHTISDVAAGSHSITRGSGETGLFAIIVEYTGAVMTQLTAPEITVNAASGEVTIGAVANASKVTYTTDGSEPTDESTEYTAAFTVEDGVTIKAVAIGDGVSYTNSTIASKVAYIDGITVAEPVINQYNGTVALTTSTPGATIEYSLDNVTFNTYSRAFTLSEDVTLYARASRANCTTSSVASAAVTTISKGLANKTIWMGHGSFDNNTTNSMTGKSGDDAEGIVLTISGNSSKNWSSGNGKIAIGDIERTSIKLSNGAQNTITLPTGMKATRITFYSFINAATSSTVSYWKEFQGDAISGANVPMGAWNDVDGYLTTPDVRSFALNGDETTITFTNAGEQLCFIIALDVIEDPVVSISAAGYATLYSESALSIPSGVTAYTGKVSGSSLVLTAIEGGIIPANTAVVLEGEEGSYTFNVTTGGTAGDNDLVGGTGETATDGDLVLGVAEGVVGFYSYTGTLAANKAYIPADKVASASGLRLVFEEEGEVTGIATLRAEENATSVFDLTGRRTNTKGLVIKNGKVVLVK